MSGEAVFELGSYAFDAINQLQAEIKLLRAEIEQKDRELELMRMHLDRFVGER